MQRYISIIICWLTIGLHIAAESNISQQDCAFCKHAFAGCYCQGTDHDYQIICKKTAHDFWSLSFCSPSSIHLIWDHPEGQPRAIKQFPELPSVLDIQLDGLPAMDLDMSKIDKLEQLRIEYPRCDSLPKIKYPKTVQSLKLTADRDLKIPDMAFNDLQNLNNLTLEGRGIKEFPLSSLQSWRTATNRTDDKLICNIKNTSVRKIPKLSSDRYDVKSDIPSEPVFFWSRLFDFNRKDSSSNRECTPPPSTPITQHSDDIPLSFGPEPDTPSPSSISDTTKFISTATSDPSRLESSEYHRDDISGSTESLSTPSSDPGITPVSIAATTQGDSDFSRNGEDATPCINPLCSSSSAVSPRDASEYSNHGQDEIPLPIEQEPISLTSTCNAPDSPIPASASHSSSYLVPSEPDRDESDDCSISGRQETLILAPFIDGRNIETISSHSSLAEHPDLTESDYIDSTITSPDKQGIELSTDHIKCQHEQDPRCIDDGVKNNIEHEADINQVQCSESQAQPTNAGIGFDVSDSPHEDISNQQDLQLNHIYDSSTSSADECSRDLMVNSQILYVEEVHEPSSRPNCCCDDSQVEALDNNSEARLDSRINVEKIESEQESVADIASPQYNKSSAIDSQVKMNFPVTQIGPEPGHSPTRSGSKTTFIMMILFGTFGSTLAVIISCIRHRPRRSLLLKSKLDEEWIRAQAEPSRSV